MKTFLGSIFAFREVNFVFLTKFSEMAKFRNIDRFPPAMFPSLPRTAVYFPRMVFGVYK